MKGMQRLSLIAALCVVLLFAASPAVALEPVYIHPWCGDVDVPPGTPIVVRWGWVADTDELVDLFLDTGTYFFKVDRKPIRNTGQYWGPILNHGDFDGDGDDDWVALWEYPLGTLEDVGETHKVFSLYLLRREITDGFDLVDGDGLPDMFGAGPLRGPVSQPPWRCTVTAVQP